MKIVKVLAGLLGALLLTFGPTSSVLAVAPDAGSSGTPIPGHYIVVLKNSVKHPGSVADAQVRRRGGNLGFVYRSAIKGYAAADLSKADVEALRDDPRVKYVTPDLEIKGGLFEQAIPTGIERIGGTENSIAKINGEDERVDADVAVIDSGVDNSHPDLNVYRTENCVPSGEETTESASCASGLGGVGSGHGTHVAGTIGALDNGIGVVGVAPGARIWSVRIFTNEDSTTQSWMVAGVNWVGEHASEIEVANMSFGCYCPLPALEEAVSATASKGVVFAAAAGNESSDARNASPAKNPDVITVSALADYDGKPGGEGSPGSCYNWGPDDTLAYFSNFGSAVDVAAPGVCILSTIPGGYGVKSGTSMAAPHVAGAAALLASQDNPNSLADVEAIRQTIVGGGSFDWTDTSLEWSDTYENAEGPEPVLSVGSPRFTVATGGVTDIDPLGHTALLHGAINPGGSSTTYKFELGTSTEYGQSIPVSPESVGSGTTIVNVSQSAKGISGDGTYHYRIVATNDKGTEYGEDRTFTPTRWQSQELPAQADNARFKDVSCVSLSECVAVGSTLTETGEYPGDYLHIERWDGDEWSVESAPLPGKSGSEHKSTLFAISCTSSSFCMAVGDYFDAETKEITWFSELWDGTKWTLQPIGPVGWLSDIECTSSTSCIAVGRDSSSVSFTNALVEAWNGEEWSTISSPNPPPDPGYEGASRFESISCISASSCIAVGYYKPNTKSLSNRTLIESWNGTSWSIQSSPNLPEVANVLTGVSCSATNSCMAVGSTERTEETEGSPEEGIPPETIYIAGPLAASWDGSEWSLEESSEPMLGVSCSATDFCIGVGGKNYLGESKAGGEYWNGETWSPLPPVSPDVKSQSAVENVSCVPMACTGVGYQGQGALAVRLRLAAPWADVDPPTSVTANSATLHGSINPEGLDTTYQFEYGATTAYGTKAPPSALEAAAGFDSIGATQAIEGLSPGHVYHYRLAATNEEGTTYSEDQTFTTWGSWSTQSIPNPPAPPAPVAKARLSGTSCASAEMCMAVGEDATEERALGELWNGSEWTLPFEEQEEELPSGSLSGISCPLTVVCFVVGTDAGAPLAEQWVNFGAWVAAPLSPQTPSGASNVKLTDVSCASTSACTAVGSYFKEGSYRTLAERWNGSSWSIQTTPNPESSSVSLNGVSCDSSTSCTAVGTQGSTTASYAMRWDGTSWSASTVPSPSGATTTSLASVSCPSSSFCEAVGTYKEAGGYNKTLAERWNGSSWSVATSPNPAEALGSFLSSVSCTSSTACTAVGRYHSALEEEGFFPTETKTLVESWGGAEWQIQSSPNPEGMALPRLTGVSCTSASACTAVGWAAGTGAGETTLGERYE